MQTDPHSDRNTYSIIYRSYSHVKVEVKVAIFTYIVNIATLSCKDKNKKENKKKFQLKQFLTFRKVKDAD